MRKNDKKIFCDKSKLSQLLNLRQNGLSLTSLATIYGVDTMAISYQVHKYKLENPDKIYQDIHNCIDVNRLLKNIIPQPQTMRHPHMGHTQW